VYTIAWEESLAGKNMINTQNHHKPFIIKTEVLISGLLLTIVGAIVAGSFEKGMLTNYIGLGMLLVGIVTFVAGTYSKLVANTKQIKTIRSQQQSNIPQFSFRWKNRVQSSPILNIVGMIVSVCILFFSIWQLDLIVSGPVWWSSADKGTGFGWSHPDGAYANDYFQCFFWKTTIGQAYDTLFLLIFVAFIVMFLSAYFWPKHDRTSLMKLKNRDVKTPVKTLQLDQEKENTQPTTTTETNHPIPPVTMQEIEIHTDY